MRVASCLLVLVSLSCRESDVTLPGTPYQPPNDLRKVVPLQVGIVKEYGGNETMELISWNPHAR